MPPSNKALWLEAKQEPMIVKDAPYSPPAANEVVIRTQAVAINPADIVLQQGRLLSKYPAILGCDAAGMVEEVGSDLISQFQRGDRVVGSTSPLQDYKYAAFQSYVVLKMPSIVKIPDNVAFSDAVVFPLGINTAASCLFDRATLNLAMPPSKAGAGKTLIIWGASGSVGVCGLQLAVAAGYEVFAVASKRNHAMLQSLGASSCFDYNDSDIVDQVVAALKGKNEIVGAYDAVSTKDTLPSLCDILHQAGGRQFIAAVVPGSEALAQKGVTVKLNFGTTMATDGGLQHIWHGFLGPALAEGTLQFKPDPQVVGHGLESIQKAVDQLAAGVSAKKLVVTLE